MPHKCAHQFPFTVLVLSETPPSFPFVPPCYTSSQPSVSDSLAMSGILFGHPWLNSLTYAHHVHHNVAFIQGHPPPILQQPVEQDDNSPLPRNVMTTQNTQMSHTIP